MNAANGSEFLEMDTGKKFLFSVADVAWYEQPSSGGSGGGGTMVVHFTGNPTDGITADKTFAEVFSALQNVNYVVAMAGSHIYHLFNKAEISIAFSRVTVSNSEVTQEVIMIFDNNVCDMLVNKYPDAPE